MVYAVDPKSQPRSKPQQRARRLLLAVVNIPIVLLIALVGYLLLESMATSYAFVRNVEPLVVIIILFCAIESVLVYGLYKVERVGLWWLPIAVVINIFPVGTALFLLFLSPLEQARAPQGRPEWAPRPEGEVPPSPVQTSAYWNSWFDYQEEPAPATLTVGNSYDFVLDLSPFEYAKLQSKQVASTRVDQSIEKLLSDPQRRRLTFRIKPLLAERSGLRLAKSVDPIPLKVDLQRIREPNAWEMQRYMNGQTTPTKLSEKVAAGSLRFEIFADEPGCWAIVLSVLDETARFPLDHLVRWVSVGNPGQRAPTCGEPMAGGRQHMQGGLRTLLEVSLDVESAGTSQLAAAAFHVFETGAGSFVVFVDGRANQQRSVYAWETLTSLIKYVNDAHKLPLLIEEARRAAGKGTPHSYAKAAEELATVLFTGKGPAANDEAKSAKRVFKELVEQSPTRPVVIARVVSDLVQGQNPSFYVPLGILGASAAIPDGGGAVLKQPITVVQPLPRERYGLKTSCIDEWTFGVPTRLQGSNEDLTSLLPKNPLGKWFRDFAGLETYLADKSPIKDYPGQGFLLLAHHGNGNLWFERETQHVIVEDVERRYPPGSVGVFAACSVAAAYDSDFVKQFNALGLDALIASPFGVPTTYGTRLAVEFPQALQELKQVGQELKQAGRRLTVSDLFTRALARTADRLAQDFPGGAYQEIGLEYVLLGNPGLVLCDSTGAPRP